VGLSPPLVSRKRRHGKKDGTKKPQEKKSKAISLAEYVTILGGSITALEGVV